MYSLRVAAARWQEQFKCSGVLPGVLPGLIAENSLACGNINNKGLPAW